MDQEGVNEDQQGKYTVFLEVNILAKILYFLSHLFLLSSSFISVKQYKTFISSSFSDICLFFHPRRCRYISFAQCLTFLLIPVVSRVWSLHKFIFSHSSRDLIPDWRMKTSFMAYQMGAFQAGSQTNYYIVFLTVGCVDDIFCFTVTFIFQLDRDVLLGVDWSEFFRFFHIKSLQSQLVLVLV